MTLAQWSNLFVYASMAVCAMAMVAFAASFASARATAGGASSRRGAAGTRGRSAARTGSVTVGARIPATAIVGTPLRAHSTAGAASGGRRIAGAAVATGPLPPGRRAGNIGLALTWLSLALLAAAIVFRAIWAGRAPWGNMYEYSLASSAAIMGVFLVVSMRRDVRWLGLPVTMASLVNLGVAVLLLYNDSPQLVPALKSYWLVIHVAAAIIAGGAFTVGAAAAVLYLFADRAERDAAKADAVGPGRPSAGGSRAAASIARRLPDSLTLDSLAYRVNAFSFPLWTFAVIAGSIWAEDAWGRYWGWDPKETWALITWLVYAGYLHARATAGWRGRNSALLGLVGFGAFLVNFLGVNLFASGLHSYSGV